MESGNMNNNFEVKRNHWGAAYHCPV